MLCCWFLGKILPPLPTCVYFVCSDAGSYENKAQATGLAAGANPGYCSGLGNTGAQGAGAGWVRRSLQRWQSRDCWGGCASLLAGLTSSATPASCSACRRETASFATEGKAGMYPEEEHVDP